MRSRCVAHDLLGCSKCFPKGTDHIATVSGSNGSENLRIGWGLFYSEIVQDPYVSRQ